MFKKSKLSLAAAVAVSGVALLPQALFAQEAAQRVEITGSSIKRINAEGALPVQVINAEQIQRSGATSVADLIQKLPAMQGFSIADTAVGSNSGGIVTASIHDIGEDYTLVLLNGRRIAPTGSGSRINLNSIPMSAIERIEVLTDGASALYGSDAIAGVVNFVLKRNQQGGNVTVRTEKPLEGGGESTNASVTYGFGNLDKDRFSLVATYRHDQNEAIKATQRDFGATAYLPFEYNGKKYIYDRTSTSAVPANATVTFKRLTGETTTLPTYAFNPYQKANGKCAPMNFYSLNNAVSATSVTENCAFDFVATIEAYPESARDSFFVSGQFKINDKFSLFSDVAYTRLDLTARIAPNPVPVPVTVGSAQYNTYVAPYLSADQLAHVNTVTAAYRASDFGTRDSQTLTDGKHFVLGVDGEVGTWSLNSAFTWSQNALDERYVGGYFKTAEFNSLRTSGKIDPFVEAGKQSAETLKLIQDSIFNGSIRTASTTLTGLDMRASSEIFKLPAGAVSLGLGADHRNYHYKQSPSSAAVNGEIYNFAAPPAYDMERTESGAFAELLVPVIKGLELTGALRYDHISAINSSGKTVGKAMSASTYKLAARYQHSSSLLFRGSYGSGFKAPSMLDIAQPLVSNGVTAASYDCPFPTSDYCKPGKLQYSQMSGGNAQLRPEKSTQGTLGIRFEPTSDFSVGADYWQVKLKDAVTAVSANQAFGSPGKYSDLFMLYSTPAEALQNQQYWAFISASTNIGQQINKGVDWDVSTRMKTAMGRLTLGLSGTYLIQSSYTRPGTSNEFIDNMSHYGENAEVSFRNIGRATVTLDTGRFSHTLTAKYRSGYADQNQLVRDVASNTNVRVSMQIGDYTTFDWQTVFQATKALEFRAGVKNLLNKKPPLTLRDSSGHQVGFDPRYADPILRSVYLQGSYNF
ncbi:TonB-dependent receptor [Aquabacterium sp. OR-4]|uniref:TonB-dependent receptor n=1 Tax=Aquabacterium sp. OR-4 TaxID=2978127 RepID=UPI0028C852C4|nr:TonB-dependent receptor [Aquabacterium sp. OR-4]MDT7835332.1 TonB-dependent receptor [Aquabacterium sp. OR-4]